MSSGSSTVNMQMTGSNKLIKLGAGSTAMMVAARHGQASCVKLLLDAGADAGIANAEGKTAAALAEENGHAAIVAVLRSESHPNKYHLPSSN